MGDSGCGRALLDMQVRVFGQSSEWVEERLFAADPGEYVHTHSRNCTRRNARRQERKWEHETSADAGFWGPAPPSTMRPAGSEIELFTDCWVLGV